MIIFECDMCKMHHMAKRRYSDLNMVELNIGGNQFQICHKCASELLHKCEAGGEQYNRFHIGDIVHFLDHLEDFEIDKIHKPTKQYKEYRYDLITEGRIGFINLVNESDLVLIKRKDECADETQNKRSKNKSKYNIGDIVIYKATGHECKIEMIGFDGLSYYYTIVNCSDNSKRYIDVAEWDLISIKELEAEEASESITHEKGSLYYIKGKEGLYYITREIKPSPRSKCKYKVLKYEVENSDTHEKFIVKESELEAYHENNI